MPGTITQFVDFTSNTAGDTGENRDDSILPYADGEAATAAVLGRPLEGLRQRTEATRNVLVDTLFLRDADRSLLITGPGKVTWPGSTTVAATGIPIITDTVWILPMLTPGYAQTAPVPPVASAYGTVYLKRASDSTNALVLTSTRRSYAAGDQINVTVIPGAATSVKLDSEDGFQRTITVVAAPTTTLTEVIAEINTYGACVPVAPDSGTTIVTAALTGGAVGSDLLLDTQAKQYVSGNYDGEGHTITPANLASFFASNPSSALAEGDTLCVAYAMVTDTATTGGRRQALPENSNTTIPAGSFFNSRISPSKLVNALPICKVVNGALVFATGVEIPAGAVAAPLSSPVAANITYAGGGAWADGTTNPATTVEAQLDKIVTDLAGAAGSAKIQGVVVGTDLAVGTVKAQIDNLATNWWKLGRDNTDNGVNTFTDANYFTGAGAVYLQGSVGISGPTSVTSTMNLTNTYAANIGDDATCFDLGGLFSTKGAHYYDDFFNLQLSTVVTDAFWTDVTAGGGTVTLSNSGLVNVPHAARLASTVNAGSAYLHSPQVSQSWNNKVLYRAYAAFQAGATSGYALCVGAYDNSAPTAAWVARFELSSAHGAALQVILTNTAYAETVVSTGFTPTAYQPYWLTLAYHTATSVFWAIGNDLRTVSASGIATLSAGTFRAGPVWLQHECTQGATDHSALLYVDAVEVHALR